MLVVETRADPRQPRYSRGAMNARAVAKLIGAKIGTLNAWIARGYIRGLEVGTSGKRRDIDADTALRIAVFAELVRFGRPPDDASGMAWAFDFTKGGFLIVSGPENYTAGADATGKPHDTRLFGAIYTPSPNPADAIASLPSPSTTLLLISVTKLAANVTRAEEEWQQTRGTRPDG